MTTDSLNDIHATPITVSIAGKEISFAPLNFRQLAQFERWCQFYPYLALKEQGASTAELSTVLEQCAAKPFDMNRMEGYLQTPSGLLEFLYIATRKHHSEIGRDELGDMLSMENLAELSNVVMQISTPEATGEADQKKTPA